MRCPVGLMSSLAARYRRTELSEGAFCVRGLVVLSLALNRLIVLTSLSGIGWVAGAGKILLLASLRVKPNLGFFRFLYFLRGHTELNYKMLPYSDKIGGSKRVQIARAEKPVLEEF